MKGVVGLLLGMMMFGDIGVAAMIGALSARLSGVWSLLPTRNSKTSVAVKGEEKGEEK